MIQFFSTEANMVKFAATFSRIVAMEAKKVSSATAFIIFLHGSLGAGKTTLVRGFMRGLGYEKKIKSPTYTLVEPYEIKDLKIFHFDFYRLKEAEELYYIGIQDYFSKDAICLIEWPEKGSSLLPPADLSCYITITRQGRELRLEALSERGETILNLL